VGKEEKGSIAMKTEIAAQIRALPGATEWESRLDQLWMAAPKLEVTALAGFMRREGARLSTISAVAQNDGETELIYHYVLDGQIINLKVLTLQGAISSITPITKEAGWIEREIHDLFGVIFTGHPNLKRLIRPPSLPEGFFREAGGLEGKSRRAIKKD
jgi:NADH-quinone oxidoreductase subunit C